MVSYRLFKVLYLTGPLSSSESESGAKSGETNSTAGGCCPCALCGVFCGAGVSPRLLELPGDHPDPVDGGQGAGLHQLLLSDNRQ